MQAKSKLYARRLRGDLDLGLEPARIGGGGNRQLAEILTPGGLLPGGTEQGILEASEVQNYRIATRRVVADSVFRYCHTAEAQQSMKGAFNGVRIGGHEMHIGGGAIAGHDAGSVVVALDCADVIADNDLAGGYLCRYVAPAFRCRIISNLATVVATGIIAITLADPLPVAIIAGDRIHAYPNIYSRLAQWGNPAATGVVGDTFTAVRSVVCIPWINLLPDRWFWGQTWGFAIAGCGNQANLVGQTQNKRKVHFDGLGWAWYTVIGASLPGQQEAGYLLFNGTDANSPTGDEAYMLTLPP